MGGKSAKKNARKIGNRVFGAQYDPKK